MLLSIDPGLTFGWAFFDESQYERTGIAIPLKVGVSKDTLKRTVALPKRIKDFHFRVRSIMNECPYNGRGTVGKIVVEEPRFFSGAGGQAAAARGDLGKLYLCLGSLCSMSCDVHFVPVNDWKGQVPKDVMERRIRKYIGNHKIVDEIKSHAWDAVGIGVWHLTSQVR